MRSIEYIGYTVKQAGNHHVSIYKDGDMVMHAQCVKRLSDKELRGMVHHYLELEAKMRESGYPHG